MVRLDNAIPNVTAKAGCYLCLSPNNLVDTEMQIPYEGVLSICVGCVHDMAQTAGYNLDVRAHEVEELREALADSEAYLESATNAVQEVREVAVAATKRHRDRVRKYKGRSATPDLPINREVAASE